MKKHISLILHILVGLLFVAAIWPALNVSSTGYDGATVSTPIKTPEIPVVIPQEEVKVVEVAPTPEPEPVVAQEEPAVVEVETASSDNSAKEDEKSALYSVVDGNKLDAESYAGFKLYRNWCARCHGTYGQGMVGPNLADSLKIISEKEFFTTVEDGKSGTIGSMPAWKKNVKVMAGRDQLYAYLMARSDGAIGVEKPKKQ